MKLFHFTLPMVLISQSLLQKYNHKEDINWIFDYLQQEFHVAERIYSSNGSHKNRHRNHGESYIIHFQRLEKLTIDIACLVFSPFSRRACVCSPFILAGKVIISHSRNVVTSIGISLHSIQLHGRVHEVVTASRCRRDAPRQGFSISRPPLFRASPHPTSPPPFIRSNIYHGCLPSVLSLTERNKVGSVRSDCDCESPTKISTGELIKEYLLLLCSERVL